MEKVPGHGLCPDLLQRARPAGPEHAYPSSQPDPVPNFHLSPLLFCKSLIGRFLLRGIEGHGEDLVENGCFI